MMMASEFWHGSTAWGLAEGFRALGWDVAEIDLLHYAISGSSVLARGAQRLLWKNAAREQSAAILRAADDYQIELFVTVKGINIDPATVAQLHARGIKVVIFYPDVLFDHAGVDRATLAAADLIVTTKSYHAAALDALVGPERHVFVHHGYCRSAHARRHAPGATPYRWDIGFIGNASPLKAAYLTRAAEAFPEARFAVYGNRWEAAAAGTALARHVIGHPLMGDYFARGIEETRINLAIHHGPVGPDRWEDLTSTRTFEIPAAGGFMLHVDNAEVGALYEPGREIDVFSDADSLVERIGHYLAHEDERAEIAGAGYRRCVPAYSLVARAREIAAILKSRDLLPSDVHLSY